LFAERKHLAPLADDVQSADPVDQFAQLQQAQRLAGAQVVQTHVPGFDPQQLPQGTGREIRALRQQHHPAGLRHHHRTGAAFPAPGQEVEKRVPRRVVRAVHQHA